ncbi:pre-mRNA splicing factor [Grosmannia clavigera kw1407]|uniref:U4/U6 snRNA-associated-splicing factor PRP24 n=1 Tax=Grosmannia clavigera (strain kw1407 / UAMH 11150) TaxID=655863 RepID=F0XHP6_GROCL|nr:pre-mRNA splicing factor [Grosmannia clavigera kw1407]EFX03016.1 pre-mRNA splicing factor [Grosmannia clavigera kw1407]
MASSPAAPAAPVGDDSWIDYLEQQRRDANALEQRIRVVELYRSAVNAEPGSIRVWIAYCTYFWSLYVECSQRSGAVATWPAEEQAAAADIFSLDAALHLWNEGHEATQFRLSDSHELWNRWIALERELLDRTRTAEGVRRITHLYRNRLAIPHMAWDDTSSAFSSFLSEYNPAAYEETMRAVTEQSRTARHICERRDGMEMAQRAAQRSGSEQAQRNAMSDYLDWETANALAERDDKVTAVRVAFGLFTRALSGVFATDDGTWTDVLVFATQLRRDIEDSANRNEEVLRHLPSNLDILQRAVQHCPWSGSLWARYIVCGEQVGLSFSDIERIKHAATNSSLDRDGMAAVVEMYASWCGYLRRLAMDPNASDEAVDLADSGLVAALEAVQVWGERRFGSAFQGDPNYRLERIMIQHLTDKHGAADEAREHWEKLAEKDMHANDYSFWLSFHAWEMGLFQAQKGRIRSPTPATTNSRSQRVPSQATRVLRRALQNLHLNWPERIMEVYIKHCNDFQTVDVLLSAFDDVHKLQKLLAKHRKEVAALQAASAAQTTAAEEELSEAQAQTPTQDPGEPQTIAAAHDTVEGQDSPSSTKRKRETDVADDMDELASKRARSEQHQPPPLPPPQQQQQRGETELKRDRENTSVYVANLPADVTSTKVRQYFRDYGHVNNIQLQREEKTKSMVALVEFRSVEDVQSALIRDGKYFGDQTISVKAAAGVTLFLTNFPPTTDDAYIHELFKKCGEIFGIRWPSLKFNAHRRFCYVSFRDAEAAARAVQLDGKMLDGRYKLSAKYSDPARKKSREGAAEEGREVHVKNLGFDVDEQGLQDLFERYGNVERVRLLRNIGGRSRGSGFVVFATKEEAERAVAELDKVKFGSQILSVDLSVPAAFKPAAREASATPEAGAGEGGSPTATTATTATTASTTGDGATKAHPRDRTFALLGIPDTVGIARVRALAEPHGHIVKLVLRADHGGAIIEFGDAAAAGAAQLALTGSKLDGQTLRTGPVASLFHEKAAVRIDRVDRAVPKTGVKAGPGLAAALMPARVKRPTLGVKGAKRGVVVPGFVTAAAAATKSSGEEATPTKKSNAEFRALFLGGGRPKDESSDGPVAAKATANGSKTDGNAAADEEAKTNVGRI